MNFVPIAGVLLATACARAAAPPLPSHPAPASPETAHAAPPPDQPSAPPQESAPEPIESAPPAGSAERHATQAPSALSARAVLSRKGAGFAIDYDGSAPQRAAAARCEKAHPKDDSAKAACMGKAREAFQPDMLMFPKARRRPHDRDPVRRRDRLLGDCKVRG